MNPDEIKAFNDCKTEIDEIDSTISAEEELRSMQLSGTVKYIGNLAFDKSGLTSFEIPRSVTSIGIAAFQDTKLKSITIPSNVKDFKGGHTFKNCKELETVTIEESEKPFRFDNNDIGIFASCRSLKQVNLTSNFGSVLPNSTFLYCTSLEEITLPKTTHIGTNAFSNCTALKTVTAPKLRVAKQDAFKNCKSLTSIAFAPDSNIRHEIGAHAFANCTSLTKIDFGNVNNVEKDAFDDCDAITEVTINSDFFVNAFKERFN